MPKGLQGFQKGNKLGSKITGKNHYRWKGGKMKLYCVICGKEFKVKNNRGKIAKYCSHKCRSEGRKKLKGLLHYKIIKKNKGWFTPERIKGEKSHNWKGGISSERDKIRGNIEFLLWRKAVFQRDDFICQKYGIKGGKLNAHHINNFSEFSELRTSISNGITLSEKAHKEFHRIYGKQNNTREQMVEFLTRKNF